MKILDVKIKNIDYIFLYYLSVSIRDSLQNFLLKMHTRLPFEVLLVYS